MDIWDTNKLALFIAFVVPGFISLKTYALLFPRAPRSSSEQLIDAIAYSSVNYALLLWPIYEVEQHHVRSSHPTLYVLFYVVVLLVAPIIWACLLRWLRTTDFLQRFAPHPTEKPWDYFFLANRERHYWVIVTMKDGTKIAGKYGCQSFVTSAPAAEQLYLEETWVLNDVGGFDRPRLDTAGIMILSTDMLSVEFFNVSIGANDAGQED